MAPPPPASARRRFLPVLLRRPPSPARLSALLAEAATAPLTYPEVGASLDARPPGGYTVLEEAAVLGSGPAVWARVADGVLAWDLHRGAGMTVAATGPASEVGATVVAAAPLGPLTVGVACRVVAVIDEPGRRGFVYGTLPGHPVTGEERFTVELGDDGRVRFRLHSFSRPVGLPATVFAQAGQRLANHRFVAAARAMA